MGLVEDAFRTYLSGLRRPAEITFLERTLSGSDMLEEMKWNTELGREFRRRLLQYGFDWIGRVPREYTVDDFLEELAAHLRAKIPITYGVLSYPEPRTFTNLQLADEVEAKTRWGLSYARMVLATAIAMKVGR